MVNCEKEESVGETPTGATETVMLPGKPLMIGLEETVLLDFLVNRGNLTI